MTNYWWLLIWMFTGGVALSAFFPEQKEYILGKPKMRWKIIPAIVLVIPYIFWAAYRSDGFGDTSSYKYLYDLVPDSLGQIGEYVAAATKDKGFAFLQVLIKSIFGNNTVTYFLVFALFQMLCVSLIIRKYSCDYWLSIFLFIASTDYMSWVQNGMRQFTAVTLIFASTSLILKKKYVPLILIIILASTVHQSALLMIPVVFIVQGKAWNRKALLCIALTVIVLVMADHFTDILDTVLSDTQYTNVVSDWQELNDDGTNPLRVLVYAVPTILSIVGYKYIKKEDDPVINMAVNAGIISTSIAIVSMVTSGVFIGRLPIYCSLYSSYILLPWEINNMFNEKSATFVKFMAMACFIVFFYFQMHISWGLI